MIIDGIEYILVPKNEEKSHVNSEMPENTSNSPILEFLGQSSIDPDSNKEEKEIGTQVKIIEENNNRSVIKAVGKKSEYRERFKKKKLLPTDIAVLRPKIDIDKFRDLDIIELDSKRSSKSQMFYGPGIEADF